MDTVFLVRMRLMTSSWVHEEMEYPLIRTISSPTLATDRENEHQVEGSQAAGQAHWRLPRACSPGRGIAAMHSFRRNLDMCVLEPCHNQPTLHQPGYPRAVALPSSLSAPFYRGNQDGRGGAQRVGSRAGRRSEESAPSLWGLFHPRGTPRCQQRLPGLCPTLPQGADPPATP